MIFRALVTEQNLGPVIDRAIAHKHTSLKLLTVPGTISVALQLADPNAWLMRLGKFKDVARYEHSIVFREIDTCFMSKRIVLP